MSSIGSDPRFSKVLTDPRFLPMPTYEKKVKIDKRFNALFTSKEFGHRTLRDKRGRPIHDVSKRSKHLMEQYYDISSNDSSSSESDEDVDHGVSEEESKSSSVRSNKDNDLVKKKRSDVQSKTLKKKEKTVQPPKRNKRSVPEEDDDELSEKVTKPPKKKKRNIPSGEDHDTKEEEEDDDELSHKPINEDEENESNESDDDDDECSESDDSSESDDDDEEATEYTKDDELEDTTMVHKWNELHSDAPHVTESTHRLALCNMDWDFVKAQDLFVLFNSFAGEGESVRSVVIYPSEFGKERMTEEAELGPKEMRENLKKEKEMKQNIEQKKKKKNKTMDGQVLKRMEKEMANAEREVLRNYQLNRLRYYFAVIDCSSAEAADNIYKECDGQEYQLSCVTLDLRYIPDDTTFEDTPKESFSEEQGLVDYTPQTFSSSALSQAKVEVTWDETEFDRLRKRMLTVQHKEMEDIVEENRYADIIAPPESDSDFEDDDDGRPEWLKTVLANQSDDDSDADEITEEKKIELYRKVLMDKLVEEEEKEKKDNEIDKELSWKPGLKAAVQEKLKKTEKTQGGVVDEFLEKKKEKKKKKRDKKKAEWEKVEDDESEEAEEDDVEMPDIIDNSLKEMMASEGVDVDSLQKKKLDKKTKKTKVEDNSEDEREKAELELLLMGDEDEKGVSKPEKVQEGKLSKRQKKKRALLEKEKKKKLKDELTIDVDDQRFESMFSSHHFHIDPSAPEFKKTKNMMKLVDEQIKRKPKSKSGNKKGSDASSFTNGQATEEETDSRTVSKKLVESLKKKMKKR